MRELSRKIVVLVSAIFLSISMISASFADGHGKKILFSIKGPGLEILSGLLLQKVLKKKLKN